MRTEMVYMSRMSLAASVNDDAAESTRDLRPALISTPIISVTPSANGDADEKSKDANRVDRDVDLDVPIASADDDLHAVEKDVQKLSSGFTPS